MSSHSQNQPKEQLAGLALGAIGVVFGDIGTSPLYALKEVFLSGLTIDGLHVLGALSLVFWTLTLVVTTKYAIFIMRADKAPDQAKRDQTQHRVTEQYVDVAPTPAVTREKGAALARRTPTADIELYKFATLNPPFAKLIKRH